MARWRRPWAQAQHRNALLLALNNLVAAATGIAFWLFFVRWGRLDAAVVGVGYSVIAVGTIVAVLAKGGLDTALLQKVPATSRRAGWWLLAFACAVGAGLAATMTIVAAAAAHQQDWLRGITTYGWLLTAAIATLLLVTWLQDAYFVAVARTRITVERNLVLSAARLVLPLPVLALGLSDPVAITLVVALAASAILGTLRARSTAERAGQDAQPRKFLQSATRNLTGGAAEVLPGLLLAPLILATRGPEAAAYFGIAWTAAALLFQTSGAVSRSVLAEIIRTGSAGRRAAIRRGALHNVLLVLPMALLGAALAPQVLGVFGHDYALHGAPVLVLLCASALFVAPASLYLAVLRARDRSTALVVFPAAMVAVVAILAPLLAATHGLAGVAWAWLAAQAPFGMYAAWALLREGREVNAGARLPHVDRRADVE